jgi:hypothetical protein
VQSGVTAAILAVTLVVGRLRERAEEYRKAGRRFGAIRREIEEARLVPPDDAREMPRLVAHFRDSLDKAAEDSANAPPGLWNKTDRQLKRKFHALGEGLRLAPRAAGTLCAWNR